MKTIVQILKSNKKEVYTSNTKKLGFSFLVVAVLTLLSITTASAQADFILTYNTSLPGTTDNNSLRIPAVGGLYDVDVGNDGSFEYTNITGPQTIDVTTFDGSFPILGVYTIQVAIRNNLVPGGTFNQIQFNNTNDGGKLISIDQWGSSIAWTSMENAFYGCSNLTITATDTPNLASVTST
jgi:hypothetical protein